MYNISLPAAYTLEILAKIFRRQSHSDIVGLVNEQSERLTVAYEGKTLLRNPGHRYSRMVNGYGAKSHTEKHQNDGSDSSRYL